IPEFVNVIAAQRIVRCHGQPNRAIHARKFLDHCGVFHVAQPRPAVLFRKNNAEQPHLRELRQNLLREMRSFIPFQDVRRNLPFRKFAHALAQLLLFFAKPKIHGGCPLNILLMHPKSLSYTAESRTPPSPIPHPASWKRSYAATTPPKTTRPVIPSGVPRSMRHAVEGSWHPFHFNRRPAILTIYGCLPCLYSGKCFRCPLHRRNQLS